MYRGEVVNSNDPLKKGRIQFKCAQVYGKAVSGWAWPVSGVPGQNRMPYGIFSSGVDQTLSSTTVVSFDRTEDNTNIKLVDSTKLKVEEGGDYFFQFSAQFAKAGSSAGQADIWLRKNGTDIPRTRSRVALQGNPNELLATLNFIVDLEANDYVQIVAGIVSGTDISLEAFTNNPSIIASLNLIGKYKPKKGSPVWVMFEGGDPNFPIWIGTF